MLAHRLGVTLPRDTVKLSERRAGERVAGEAVTTVAVGLVARAGLEDRGQRREERGQRTKDWCSSRLAHFGSNTDLHAMSC